MEETLEVDLLASTCLEHLGRGSPAGLRQQPQTAISACLYFLQEQTVWLSLLASLLPSGGPRIAGSLHTPLMRPAPSDYQSHIVTQLPWGICVSPFVSSQEMKKWRSGTKTVQPGRG